MYLSWIKTIYQESVHLASQRRKQLQFAGVVFVFLGWLFYRWYDLSPSFYWHLSGLSFVVIGLLLLPQLLYPVLFVWFYIGKIIGEIVSTILISLLYFLFIWIAKLFVKVDLKPGWKSTGKERDYSSMG